MLLAMITDGIFEAYEATSIRIEIEEIVVEVEDELELEIDVEES